MPKYSVHVRLKDQEWRETGFETDNLDTARKQAEAYRSSEQEARVVQPVVEEVPDEEDEDTEEERVDRPLV